MSSFSPISFGWEVESEDDREAIPPEDDPEADSDDADADDDPDDDRRRL